MNRIKNIFQNKSEKVIPYITAGYPRKEDTLGMILAVETAGAAMVEIGMPFSDPLADGPAIQASNQIAIENGVDIVWILDTVAEIRKQSEIPIVLMGYMNPIIKYGLPLFVKDCKAVGVDGLIVPDLPPEEATEFLEISKKHGIVPILLVAPNTPDIRINEISKLSGELIYCVAILGITGGKSTADDELQSYLKRVDVYSDCPFIVGFGIKERLDVVNVNKIAHGAVVGSAIIKEINKSSDSIESVKKYIEKLKL